MIKELCHGGFLLTMGQSWLLAESIRRTTVMSFAFVCMTSILKSLERTSVSPYLSVLTSNTFS